MNIYPPVVNLDHADGSAFVGQACELFDISRSEIADVYFKVCPFRPYSWSNTKYNFGVGGCVKSMGYGVYGELYYDQDEKRLIVWFTSRNHIDYYPEEERFWYDVAQALTNAGYQATLLWRFSLDRPPAEMDESGSTPANTSSYHRVVKRLNSWLVVETNDGWAGSIDQTVRKAYLDLDVMWHNGVADSLWVGEVELPARYIFTPDSGFAFTFRVYCTVSGHWRTFSFDDKEKAFAFLSSVDGPAELEEWLDGDWEKIPSAIEWYDEN